LFFANIPDVSHRANFRNAFGIFIVAAILIFKSVRKSFLL
jgi:hypothetical protein